MNKQSIIFSALIFVLGAFVMAPKVNADMCTTQYGGTTTCQASDLTINKKVQNPISNVFVDNLTTTDPTFAPGNQVLFQLTITNTSGQTFDPVTVHDIFPPYVTFVAGPGTYDRPGQPGGTLTFTLNKLIAGETRTVEILGKVVDANQLPSTPSLFCVINTGNVSALNRSDSDTAQLCIGQRVLGVSTLPVAGFNDIALLLPFAGVGLSGIVLLKGKKRG